MDWNKLADIDDTDFDTEMKNKCEKEEARLNAYSNSVSLPTLVNKEELEMNKEKIKKVEMQREEEEREKRRDALFSEAEKYSRLPRLNETVSDFALRLSQHDPTECVARIINLTHPEQANFSRMHELNLRFEISIFIYY